MLLLGHRGARADRSVQENSLASFDLALDHGCDGFEFDVRRTEDGFAVVCHDPKFRSRSIATSKRARFPSLCVLEDVLSRYQGSAFLDIELKVAGVEQRTISALAKLRPARGYVVSSFLPEVVETVHSLSPETAVGIICDRPKQLARWRSLPVQYVIAEAKLIDRELVEEIHSAGRKIFAWTINDRRTMLRFANYGVDGLISDDTRELVQTFTEST